MLEHVYKTRIVSKKQILCYEAPSVLNLLIHNTSFSTRYKTHESGNIIYSSSLQGSKKF